PTLLTAARPHQPVGIGTEEPQHGEQLDEARDIAPVSSDHGDQTHTDGKGAKSPYRQQQDRSAGAAFMGENALGGGSINDAGFLPTLHLSFETHVASVIENPRRDRRGPGITMDPDINFCIIVPFLPMVEKFVSRYLTNGARL